MWKTVVYLGLMAYITMWSFNRAEEDNKIGIAFLFISGIIAITSIYVVFSRKDS